MSIEERNAEEASQFVLPGDYFCLVLTHTLRNWHKVDWVEIPEQEDLAYPFKIHWSSKGAPRCTPVWRREHAGKTILRDILL